MPKEYTDCVKKQMAKGKPKKEAQKICAIAYYKKHGETVQEYDKKKSKSSDLMSGVAPGPGPAGRGGPYKGSDDKPLVKNPKGKKPGGDQGQSGRFWSFENKFLVDFIDLITEKSELHIDQSVIFSGSDKKRELSNETLEVDSLSKCLGNRKESFRWPQITKRDIVNKVMFDLIGKALEREKETPEPENTETKDEEETKVESHVHFWIPVEKRIVVPESEEELEELRANGSIKEVNKFEVTCAAKIIENPELTEAEEKGLVNVYSNSDDDLEKIEASTEFKKNQKDMLYVEFKLVHVGTNGNKDHFELKETKAAYPTILYKPIDWEHENPTIGAIYRSEFVEKPDDPNENPYIHCNGVVWAWRYPEYAQEIRNRDKLGELTFSVETWYEKARCSECGKTFAKNDAYCEHLKSRFNDNDYSRHLVNYFFGSAGVVRVPADSEAEGKLEN